MARPPRVGAIEGWCDDDDAVQGQFSSGHVARIEVGGEGEGRCVFARGQSDCVLAALSLSWLHIINYEFICPLRSLSIVHRVDWPPFRHLLLHRFRIFCKVVGMWREDCRRGWDEGALAFRGQRVGLWWCWVSTGSRWGTKFVTEHYGIEVGIDGIGVSKFSEWSPRVSLPSAPHLLLPLPVPLQFSLELCPHAVDPTCFSLVLQVGYQFPGRVLL